jgi:hypothetical protein
MGPAEQYPLLSLPACRADAGDKIIRYLRPPHAYRAAAAIDA